MAYRKKPEHNYDNYLKVILESLEHYNSIERIDIANLLFEVYKNIESEANREANRKVLALELLSKWIQVIEDLAILCLMFSGYVVGDTRNPFEIYAYIHTKKVLEFYEQAKKGFPKKAIANVYAIKTAQTLLKERVINKKEYPHFKKQVDGLIRASDENLKKLASLFTARRKKGKPTYGLLVHVYFQTKHGFKIIQPTETAKKLWNFDDTDIAILKDVANLRSGRKVMRISLFKKFDDTEMQLLRERVKGWSEVISEIVGAQLRRLENPNFLVPMIRKIKTDELVKTTGIKPCRNDTCPCESGLKYKKCCLAQKSS